MVLNVRRESLERLDDFEGGLPLTSTMFPASIAISVPVPIAIPRSACANAGASLMPSPTNCDATPAGLKILHVAAPCPAEGTSANTSSIPIRSAIDFAVLLLSPVIITVAMALGRVAAGWAAFASLFQRIGGWAMTPISSPLLATAMAVFGASLAHVDVGQGSLDRNALVPHSRRRFPTTTTASGSPPRDAFFLRRLVKSATSASDMPCSPCGTNDRLAQGMFRHPLETRRDPENLVFCDRRTFVAVMVRGTRWATFRQACRVLSRTTTSILVSRARAASPFL